MLLELISDINVPAPEELARIFLRWAHFVAGITWVGLLYYFNLVNVPLMKKLDGPTKRVVVPELMWRALSYFRWGALVTVFVGLTYYAMYIVAPNARNVGEGPWGWLGKWFGIVLLLYIVFYGALQKIDNGYLLAVVVAILSIALIWAMLAFFPKADNKTFSIGVGGGMGMWMLLNVWGIIWRAQKKIITATAAGEAPPAALARRAFLASRANAWLSLPMLFFMGTSHGDYTILGTR
jgi:uncharacterized membrane protein